jgi:hypothetical protein
VARDLTEPYAWLFVLVVAFLAGFSERLVPDLLERSTVTTTRPAPGAVTTAPTGASMAAPAATVVMATAATVPGAAGIDVVHAHQVDEDADRLEDCLCDRAVGDNEATSDVELPVAVGGVASPRTPIGA